jgi:ribonuclease HI
MSITIYTDGSCETQTRIGGYAAILQCGEHRHEIVGHAEDVTVNVMKLTAVIAALKVLKTARQTISSLLRFLKCCIRLILSERVDIHRSKCPNTSEITLRDTVCL